MKRPKIAAMKRPAAAAGHSGLRPLKRPAMSRGAATLSKPPSPGTADSEEDCPLSGELQFYDSESGRGSYQENAERVKAGNGLILVARDAEGYRLGEVLYQISDTMDHQTGIMVEGSYLVSSAKVGSNYTTVNRTSGRLLHLCKRTPCGLAKKDPPVVLVAEWKAFSPTAVREPWVGPKAIQRLIQEPKKTQADKTTASQKEAGKVKTMPECGDEGEDEMSNEEQLPAPPAAKARAEPVEQLGNLLAQ